MPWPRKTERKCYFYGNFRRGTFSLIVFVQKMTDSVSERECERESNGRTCWRERDKFKYDTYRESVRETEREGGERERIHRLRGGKEEREMER